MCCSRGVVRQRQHCPRIDGFDDGSGDESDNDDDSDDGSADHLNESSAKNSVDCTGDSSDNGFVDRTTSTTALALATARSIDRSKR